MHVRMCSYTDVCTCCVCVLCVVCSKCLGEWNVIVYIDSGRVHATFNTAYVRTYNVMCCKVVSTCWIVL